MIYSIQWWKNLRKPMHYEKELVDIQRETSRWSELLHLFCWTDRNYSELVFHFEKTVDKVVRFSAIFSDPMEKMMDYPMVYFLKVQLHQKKSYEIEPKQDENFGFWSKLPQRALRCKNREQYVHILQRRQINNTTVWSIEEQNSGWRHNKRCRRNVLLEFEIN